MFFHINSCDKDVINTGSCFTYYLNQLFYDTLKHSRWGANSKHNQVYIKRSFGVIWDSSSKGICNSITQIQFLKVTSIRDRRIQVADVWYRIFTYLQSRVYSLKSWLTRTLPFSPIVPVFDTMREAQEKKAGFEDRIRMYAI